VAQVVYPDAGEAGYGAELMEMPEHVRGAKRAAVRAAEDEVVLEMKVGPSSRLLFVFGAVMTGVVLLMLDRV
jgi:hypothetical protein